MRKILLFITCRLIQRIKKLVQEIVVLVFRRCLYNKQNIACPLLNIKMLIFSCSSQYLSRWLRSLVRYRLEHSKIKFVSKRGQVISSICSMGIYLGWES